MTDLEDILMNRPAEIEPLEFEYGENEKDTVLSAATMCSKTLENIENVVSGVPGANQLGNYDVTQNFHDQKSSALCVVFSTTTALRKAMAEIARSDGTMPQYNNNIGAGNHHPYNSVKEYLEKDAKMSHRVMRAKYAYAVYPRCHDGIGYDKWGRGLENCNEQTMVIKKALDRLCYPTMFMDEGWKIIQEYDNYVSFFKTYKMNPADYILEYEEVLHPLVQSQFNQLNQTSLNNFDDILQQKGVLVTNCLFNYKRNSDKTFSAQNGHAMVLVGIEKGEYVFKNSYANQPIIKIPKKQLTFSQMNSYNSLPSRFGLDSAKTMFLYEYAYCLRFRRK